MRMTTLAILLLAGTASADPAATPLSPADHKAFVAALRQGRALQAKHDWKGAIAQLQAAAKLDPGDAVALGELGWTQYLAKDYPAAEASTRKALAATAKPDTRGATLYNLGLIEEAKGDKPAAIAAYTESLKARPNAVVRKTLAKLDPAAAAAFDVFKPVAMAGPFATVEAYCATQPKANAAEGLTCTCGLAAPSPKAKRSLAAPYTQIEDVANVCKDPESEATDRNETAHALAVKTAAGWFVAPGPSSVKDMRCSGTAVIASAQAVDFAPAAGAELAVHWDLAGSCEYTHADTEWSETDLTVIGGARAPFATAGVAIAKFSRDMDATGGPSDGKWIVAGDGLALAVTYGKGDGTITVAGKMPGYTREVADQMLGAHAVVFP